MHVHSRAIIVLALSTTLLSNRAASSQERSLETRVDALAAPLVDAELTLGLVVGVLKDGKSWTRGYGLRARENDDRPNGDTVYEIGSITKVFTGMLLADAVQRGLAKLDDPVQRFLPAGVTAPTLDEQPIRLVHLATHTAALPSLPANFKPENPNDPFADFDPAALHEGLKRTRLGRAPGGRYLYSNLGAGLLGYAMVRANESKGYETLVTERILKPLGLADTRITLTPAMRARLAPPYTAGAAKRGNWSFDVLAGCGALRSTANDLLRFARANVELEPAAMRAVIEAAQEEHYTPPEAQRRRGGRSVCLGWHRGIDPAIRYHNGATGGYRAYLAIHKKRKLAVVVLANTTDGTIDRLGDTLLGLLLGVDVKPLKLRYPIAVPRDVLARYAGAYTLDGRTSVTVELRDGGLFAQLTGQPSWRLFPSSKTRFFYRVVKAEITFRLDDAGEVTGLVLHQNGRNLKAKRRD